MRVIVTGVLLSILFPLIALGQDTAPASSVYCPQLSQSLSFGMRDSQTVPKGQVTELQKFLSDYYDLNPDDYITGYFGRLTRDNVRKFQCEKMQICTGDESTTGYGVVGPKTRTKIAASCGSATNTYSQSSYTPYAEASYYAESTYYSQSAYTTTQPPTCTLSVTPASIQSGGFAALSFTTTNATSRVIDHGIGEVAESGSHYVTNVTNTTTYTMTVSNSAGTSSCKTTLTIISPYAQSSYYSQSSYTGGYAQGSYGGSTAGGGSCTYKGQTYAEGQTIAPVINNVTGVSLTCDNGAWIWPAPAYPPGLSACDLAFVIPSDRMDLGCTSDPNTALAGFSPRHGKAHLTITVKTNVQSLNYAQCGDYVFEWGDGTTETVPISNQTSPGCPIEHTHTYSSAGSYVVNFSANTSIGPVSSHANIRVDP